MRSVFLLSFVAGCVGVLIFGLGFFHHYLRADASFSDIMIMFIMLITSALQLLYVLRVIRLIPLRDYKQSDSLDDFVLNDTEIGERIISISLSWKVVNFFSSFLMIIVFTQMIGALPRSFSVISSMKIHHLDEASLVFFPVYIVTVPFAVLFNLRTFNLKKISE